MKLLFDQNLSPDLVHRLAEVFPQSSHVRTLGLASANDSQVWSRAGNEGFAIVSKDADFRQRAFLLGPPPKVISVGLGNCTTTQVETLLRSHSEAIRSFLADPNAALLQIP